MGPQQVAEPDRPDAGNVAQRLAKLKHDIVPLARLDNGIGIYRFQYKGNDHTTYVGVMAQEVAKIVPSAVSRGRDGYLRVNYDQIGVKFMTWEAWKARSHAAARPAH